MFSYDDRLDRACLFIAAWLVSLPLPLFAGHSLQEPPDDGRTFRVHSQLEVEGQLETSTGDGGVESLELHVDAVHEFLERRLPAAGGRDRSLRALRSYRRAAADIEVDGRTSASELRNSRRQIVAEGHRAGVTFYSPSGPLTRDELDLLEMPGESLAVQALLPPNDVEVGETWTPPDWAVQMLAGVEAVAESELTCTLKSVEADSARVGLEGRLEGATLGSETKIEISGVYVFDRKERFLKRLELEQTEDRSVGPVSPGMDVEAKVVFDRRPAESAGPVAGDAAEGIPPQPKAGLLRLSLPTPWKVRLSHHRNWHLFHQSDKVTVLRLVEKGSLIAQCNVTKVTEAEPGEHTPVEQFVKDVRTALQDRLESIETVEELTTDDGTHTFRVVAVGEAGGRPMQWRYYLHTAPSGRQIAFVFSVEEKLADRLQGRDLELVHNVEFLSESPDPPTAGSRPGPQRQAVDR